MTGPCIYCRRVCKNDVCSKCQKAYSCSICHSPLYCDEKKPYCQDCREVLRNISLIHESINAMAHDETGHEARVRYYIARAESQLPLFTEVIRSFAQKSTQQYTKRYCA